MRPIAHACDEPMLDRIDMAIFDVASIIGLIADQVFPKTALPDAALIAREANCAPPLLFRQRFRKTALDESPAHREIVIARRQTPDRMQVVGQHDESVNREGMAAARGGDRLAE